VKPALVDTNVLLALAWPNHQHHAVAHRWFARESRHGWATCAFTQLGFVRLSSNPAYTPNAVSPAEAAMLLERWVAHPKHVFWSSPPAAPAKIYARALGHQQVNDAWLVEAARRAGGRLVTLDTRLHVHDTPKGLVHLIAP
jgi:toxin-antitoxin system PIN domain toxin